MLRNPINLDSTQNAMPQTENAEHRPATAPNAPKMERWYSIASYGTLKV
jgi:hypothetical protein